ncbi:MAG: sugar phosphate isomerase/epimerase, partial [Actinomycetota bacterium]|nr:sugar phosphate isomerase/epimerase [Actinomycetota bacterium]
QDLARALDVCEDEGVGTVELRAVGGLNIVSHDDDSLEEIWAMLDRRGFRVGAIASPFLKCHLQGEGVPEGATHFAAPASRAEQWSILDRSFEVARLFGAPLVRGFSFWRLPDPEAVREEVAAVIVEAAERTGTAGLTLGIENEHACNLATGAETRWVLDRAPSPTLGVIWDPGNEAVMDSEPFPGGYEQVRGRIVHVHLKDADEHGNWTKMGSGIIDYAGQFRALAEDGYEGLLSLETHYEVPDGGAEKATRESLAAIRGLCKEAGIRLGA